ncbi:MAG: ferredoxin [Bacteroidales bacterium]|mgnify:CR=1 FL=1|nr:ferredoxin [Bacteroidales bacterium]
MPKLSHNRNQCIHCGACTSVCPEFFEDNGEITLKGSNYIDNVGVLDIPDDKKATAQDAIDICPVGCIKIE